MKVLLINGSSNLKGCTFTALSEVARELENQGIQTEILQIGAKAIRDCIACNGCVNKGKCVFDDDIANIIIEKAKEADGFIFGSPVYYAHPSGRILSVLDRAFYAGGKNFEYKPAASIVSARRAGTTASLDALNKYCLMSQMPLVASTYWCMVHGKTAEDVQKDEEGLQTMRNLAKNMAWILKCIQIGKENGVTAPVAERDKRTNFIR